MGKQVRFLEGAGHTLIDATVVPKNRKVRRWSMSGAMCSAKKV
jgi:hypothetical protein